MICNIFAACFNKVMINNDTSMFSLSMCKAQLNTIKECRLQCREKQKGCMALVLVAAENLHGDCCFKMKLMTARGSRSELFLLSSSRAVASRQGDPVVPSALCKCCLCNTTLGNQGTVPQNRPDLACCASPTRVTCLTSTQTLEPSYCSP